MGASFGVSLPVLALNNAFLGQPTRLGKRGIRSAQVLTTSAVGANFGDPVVIVPNASGGGDTIQSVKDFITAGGAFTAAKFAGVAVREVKTQTQYSALLSIPATLVGLYGPGDMADFLEEGSIGVAITYGNGTSGAAPASQGPVFVRITANGTYPNSPVGSFCGAADGANTVQLNGVVFRTGVVDGNNVAEITLLNRVAA